MALAVHGCHWEQSVRNVAYREPSDAWGHKHSAEGRAEHLILMVTHRGTCGAGGTGGTGLDCGRTARRLGDGPVLWLWLPEEDPLRRDNSL